jgi:predicted AAA+ superfamily ATPase
MLSSEISTYLTGRYIEFEIFPLSYSEFLDFHDMIESTDAFTLYMQYGGLPYLHHVDLSPEIGYDYLQSVYSTIVLRDIIQRYAIRNTLFLAKLMQYIADNIGSIFTANNISKYLKSQKVDIGTNVVIEYIQLVVNVYLVHRVQRQEIV